MSSAHDDYVRIFDTTLRDGEQSPGATMTLDEKLRIAKKLEDLGVDVIEAGFPAASPGELESVRADRRRCSSARRSPALCRTREPDIEAVAGRRSARRRFPRLHVFIATSKLHMESKLKMAPDQVLEEIRRGVAHCASLCKSVEFSAEDATRTDLEFLKEVFACAVENGATVVNIPDTVGYTMPQEYTRIVTEIRKVVGDRAIISTHCHNDLGPRGRQLARRGRGWRAPGRVLRERHRRARGQRRARGNRDGAQGPARPARLRHAHRHAPADEHEPADQPGHRPARAGEQADRRPQRVRARSRHPPARHDEGPAHLRDHAPGGHRPDRVEDRARQALRPPRAAEAPRGARLRDEQDPARPRVRQVQAARRQEEEHLRRGSRPRWSPTTCSTCRCGTCSSRSSSRAARARSRGRACGSSSTGSTTTARRPATAR